MNRLQTLASHGQSIWLDFIDRPLLDEGRLARMVADDAVVGVTSNPSIFHKAIASTDDYAAVLRELAPGAGSAKALYEQVAIGDIRDAADVLAGVYGATAKRDGYVSLEVSPELARDTEGTVDEARRLWAEVGRPNLMIKVPGTPEGIPAIETLIGEGINVNVTLLFAREMYERSAQAYIAGLERRLANGQSVEGIASVASFFVSRIDAAVDAMLRAADNEAALVLVGKTAIANARLAYAHYEGLVQGERWKMLADAGAMPQRLLWASTSTKDPAFRDVLYVETLIGPDTVNTLPPATLEAFRDHGESRNSLGDPADKASAVLAAIGEHGVDMATVTDRLLDDGIASFASAFASLLDAVEAARSRVA